MSVFALLLWFAAAEPSLTVLVEDQQRLPAPGAAVVIRAGELAVREARTAADGTLHIALTPGAYTVEISLDGFQPERRPIRIGRAGTSLRVRLRVAALRTAVNVDGAAGQLSVDPAENRDAIPLDRGLLDALPSLDHDFLALAQQFLDPAAVATGGASLVVDGVEARKLDVTASAIQEVRVNRNPYSAEYSRPGSARVEVITKQGTREIHGEINLLARHDSLDARHAFAETKPRHARHTIEGSLTGPLGGRNTFVLSGEHDDDREQAVVYAQTPNGIFRENVPATERESEVSLRLNRYHSERHSFSFRGGFDRGREEGLGAGGLTLPEAVADNHDSEYTVQFGHRWFFSRRGFTDFNLRLERDREQTVSRSARQRIVVEDAFTAGGAQEELYGRTSTAEASFTASYIAGRHTLRAGVQAPEMDWETLDDRANFGGTFTFASLADYAAGRPLSFTRRLGDSLLRYHTHMVAAFFQDDVQLRQGVSLSFGARYSRQNFLGDNNDIAPRAGVAWAVGEQRKTVIRAGAGIFFDDLDGDSIADLLRLDGVRLRQALIVNPPWPEGEGSLLTVPPDVTRLARGARSPYWLHASAGVERQLAPGLSLAMTYTRSRGIRRFRLLDVNAPRARIRPDPDFGPIRLIHPSGSSRAHNLSFTLTGNVAKIFRGTVIYTWGNAADDIYDGLPQDSYDLSREWGYSDFDRRQRFRLLGSFRLPARLELGAIFEAGSGRPYEWTSGLDANGDGEAAERPAGIGRNALRGPGEAQLDVRLARQFALRDKGPQLTLRLDAFNALNMVNYTRVIGNQSSPFFGQPVSADNARRLQASLELEF
jgi:hypothetical protein